MACFIPLKLVPTELGENNQLNHSPNSLVRRAPPSPQPPVNPPLKRTRDHYSVTCHTTGVRAPLAEVSLYTQQYLTHTVLDNKYNSTAEQAMSLEVAFGDSNASKGNVICHSLH